MFVFKLNHVLFLIIFHVCHCERRIHKGTAVPADVEKKYVVYMVKASVSPKLYDDWLCGGALVSAEYIVTSAACVTDVVHLYAIAGYTKYVPHDEIESDICTNAIKKKIVEICTPKPYELNETLTIWSNIDIAVVKVESPYDLSATVVANGCSYVPAVIVINYETKYQEVGIDAIAFGWGHNLTWRMQNVTDNLNQEFLNYAPTLVQDKDDCKKKYELHDGMAKIIDTYMICTDDVGNIDAAGESIVTFKPSGTADGCVPQKKCETPVTLSGLDSSDQVQLIGERRQYGIKHSNKIPDDFDYQNIQIEVRNNDEAHPGICQNDHGGPLVTWVGNHEVLLGVASVFKITEDYKCTGPYLFTSTQCNGLFIDCIVKNDPSRDEVKRRALCDRPPSEKGFELVNKTISWKDHPDGPADNEKNITSNTNTTKSTTTNPIKTKEEKKIEEKYYNYTTNLVNTTITNPVINTTITNPVINTTATNLSNNTDSLKTTITNQTTTNRIPTRTTKVEHVIYATLANLTKITSTSLNTTTKTTTTNIINTTTTNPTTQRLATS